MEMTLCYADTERVFVHVTAGFVDGCLNIEGYDAGKAVNECWGGGDYEYTYRLDAENTEKLLCLIRREDETPEEALVRAFHGLSACRDLKQFCEEHGIRYRFDSWT